MRYLIALAFLLMAAAARADIVELKTGERVEGTLKQADQATVIVEVGGQAVTFKPDQVKAIYYGSALSAHLSGLPPAASAIGALKALQSVAAAGATYRDYRRRVADAKIEVDRSIGGLPRETAAAITRAMDYYVLAAAVWEQQVTNRSTDDQSTYMYLALSQDKGGCAKIRPLRTALYEDRGDRLSAIHSAVPTVWSCAADKLAEAEQRLGAK